jgi:hypothetical protein
LTHLPANAGRVAAQLAASNLPIDGYHAASTLLTMRIAFCIFSCVLMGGCDRPHEAVTSPKPADTSPIDPGPANEVATVATTHEAVKSPEPADKTPVDQRRVNEVATTYKALKLMTPAPVFVDPMLAMLCRGASQEEVAAARKTNGPHAHTAVSIFMNDLAAGAFGKSTTPFPVGSIIVKEKQALGYRSATQPNVMTKANDGVGGMIKRPAGYDPTHGDWEYFYFDNPRSIESGKLNSCVQCHSGAAGKDYVFGRWATGG